MAPAPPFSSSIGGTARGFTLIELLTTVVVAAVLLAVAGPGLADFVRSSRLNGAQSELVSSMMLARSEAAKRGREVQLIATSGANGTDFSGGWVVGWDKNGNGSIDTANGSDEVIRSYPPPAMGVQICANAAAAAVRFAATGFLTPAVRVQFDVCDKNKGYLVSLEPVGLADVKPAPACAQGCPP